MFHRPSVRRTAVLALSLAACAPVKNAAGPFATPTARIGNRFYRVRLEVVCDQCYIRYSMGTEVASGQPNRSHQVWSVTRARSPISSERIRLTATAPVNGSAVRSVRIFVDGDLMASEDNDASQPRSTLSVETTIPPPEDREPSPAGSTSGGFTRGGVRPPTSAPFTPRRTSP